MEGEQAGRASVTESTGELKRESIGDLKRESVGTIGELKRFSQNDVIRPFENPVSGGTIMKVTAESSVEQLGFAPYGVPPNTVSVKRLEEGGWAAGQNIEVGDTLITVGGNSVSEMGKELFEKKLKTERPLRLTFLRPASTKDDKDVEHQVGKILRRICFAKRALHDAENEVATSKEELRGAARQAAHFHEKIDTKTNGASDQANLEALALLSTVAGQLDALAPAPKAKAGKLKKMMTMALLKIGPGGRQQAEAAAAEVEEEQDDDDEDDEEDDEPDEEDEEEDLPFSVTATDEVKELGFFVKREQHGVHVESVRKASWADQNGIEEDDNLLMLNDTNVANMKKEEFMGHMKGRPLKITMIKM